MADIKIPNAEEYKKLLELKGIAESTKKKDDVMNYKTLAKQYVEFKDKSHLSTIHDKLKPILDEAEKKYKVREKTIGLYEKPIDVILEESGVPIAEPSSGQIAEPSSGPSAASSESESRGNFAYITDYIARLTDENKIKQLNEELAEVIDYPLALAELAAKIEYMEKYTESSAKVSDELANIQSQQPADIQMYESQNPEDIDKRFNDLVIDPNIKNIIDKIPKYSKRAREYISDIVIRNIHDIYPTESETLRKDYSEKLIGYLYDKWQKDIKSFVVAVDNTIGIKKLKPYSSKTISVDAIDYAKLFEPIRQIKRPKILDIPPLKENLSIASNIMVRPVVIEDEVVFGEKPKSLLRIKSKTKTQLVKQVKPKKVITLDKLDLTEQKLKMAKPTDDQRVVDYVIKPKQRHNRKIRVKLPYVKIDYKEVRGKYVPYRYGNILTKEDQKVYNMLVANINKLEGLVNKYKDVKKLKNDVKDMNKLLNYYRRVNRDIEDKYH